MPDLDAIEFHLKEASQLTGASWAALVEREAGRWRVIIEYHLAKKRHPKLVSFLAQSEVDSWLSGALSGGQSRSASLPPSSALNAARLFAFPLGGTSRVTLVGAAMLSSDAQRIWRLAAAGLHSVPGNVSPSASVAASLLVPDLQSENPYDLPRALNRALDSFVRLASVQGAWLAVRRGDSLEVKSQWNAPSCANLVVQLETNHLLRRLHRTLAPLVVNRGDPAWTEIPHKGLKATTRQWTCLPLVIGQRLIGALAIWRASSLSSEEWKRLTDMTTQVAPSVETLITFAEMAGHLRRLAMLNDFALTVSSGRTLDQIARRVFGLLARAFGTELITLYLLSTDSRILREYRSQEGRMVSLVRNAEDHPVSSLLENHQTVRLHEGNGNGFGPLYETASSGLYVPLRYRGQTIGVLCIESSRHEAFDFYDESLMMVIASHLASLADYSRLREEAEGRARNLGLIHEVVQQVIGLTDRRAIAEITAELLARYFVYELAAVFITDLNQRLTISGFGGSSPNLVKRAMNSFEYPISGGITGHVFETGNSMLVNDVTQEQLYRSIQGWQAGSEMCVAIRDGDRILGIIDVESSNRNAFTQNDFLALESLAGILASVITSADQYQRLQENVRQLRAMQVELRARMDAQRAAENRLLQAAKLAAVGEMAAGIAHELNNPLTSVTGFAELLLNDMEDGSASRADMELVLHEARRARDVVRRLLDFARQSESTRARVSINEIVDDVVALTRHLVHTGGVHLQLQLAENLPWVSVDQNQMKQVLLNLVHNALQAMPDGGEMKISTGVLARDQREWVTVSVRDTGAGIPPDVQARIFEPFYTTKGKQGGTGLGLSVTYGIVTDHGGQIDVESQPGQGSCFSVRLPL